MADTSLDVDRVRRTFHRVGQKYLTHSRELGGPRCNCDRDAAEFIAAYDMEAQSGGNPLPEHG